FHVTGVQTCALPILSSGAGQQRSADPHPPTDIRWFAASVCSACGDAGKSNLWQSEGDWLRAIYDLSASVPDGCRTPAGGDGRRDRADTPRNRQVAPPYGTPPCEPSAGERHCSAGGHGKSRAARPTARRRNGWQVIVTLRRL